MSRIGRRLMAYLTLREQTRVPEVRPANLPVVGRIVAISSVECFGLPNRNTLSQGSVTQPLNRDIAAESPFYATRRPGVQGRWKSTDRVATY